MTIPKRDYRLNISAEVRALIDRANKGSAEALWELQKHFDSEPALAAYVGDLAGLAEQTIIVLACGEKSLALHDGIHRQLIELEKSLSAEGNTALEKLLIGQIRIAWLRKYTCDIQFAQAQQTAKTMGAAGITLVREAERQAHRADARFLAAKKALAQVRQLCHRPRSPLSLLKAAAAKPEPAAFQRPGSDESRVPVEAN